MRCGAASQSSRQSYPQERRRLIAVAARRRAYNRAYMRAWRADPRHRLREQLTREHAYYARKLRNAVRESRPFTDDFGRPVCGFCGKLSPISEVLRLRICDFARGGYLPVRIPYCGEC